MTEATERRRGARSPSPPDWLACPACSGELVLSDGPGITCSRCDRSYPVVEGIPCFGPADTFYDEYADEHCPFTPSPHGWKGMLLKVLPFWSYREWRFWRDVVPSGGRLLDLGCGRGKEIFIERADETVGVDSSLAFLRGCVEHYDTAYLSPLPRLPFRDACFDTVVSSHLFGHIQHDDKETLVAEIARVLKPGGITSHIVETDSAHPAIEAAKRVPELYRRHLIDPHGHVGLEPARHVVGRFERQGFQLRACRLVDAIVPSVLFYESCLDHPEFRFLPGLRTSRWLARLNRSGVLGNALYEVGFGAFHRTVEQWFGRPQRANFIHVAFEKVAA